jgi:phage-related minor tail protein
VSDTSVVFSILAVEKVTETLGKIPGAAMLSGAAIGAALMGGVSKAMDQESAANTLAAQIGATPEMAKSFGKIAGDLYSQNFGESIADIDDALKGVMQNGLIDEDASNSQIEAVTGKVINSAKLMGGSYDEVSRTVSQMLRTGVAKSADEAFDILTRGMQQGVNKSGDLLDTFNEYPTQFRKLGIDGTQAMGLLSQAIKAGARDSDVAADALKEFSIRAVNGSKATGEGFKAIGLDADEMAKKIAAGGPTASAALDMTLDRLRGMKDPTAQAAAATALFGTQAEDLGQALFAMDPSAAVGAMGDVAGAADKAGNTLSKGAGAQIEQFKRQIEQTFVDVIGGQVIPKLDNFGHLIQSVGGWAKDNWTWLAPVLVSLGTFGGIIGTIVAAYKIWTAVTAAYTAVQAILNAVMLANPIGIIVIAIAALVAGLIYAWTHSETFRKIVIGAWEGIKGAALAVWDWISGTLWPGIVGVYHAIADVALWYWHSVIEPVWNGISSAISVVWGVISQIATSMFNLWLWVAEQALKPLLAVASAVWSGIAAGAQWLWANVLSPVFGAISTGVSWVGAAAMWLWNNAIMPAFQGIGAAASWVWNSILSPTFNAVMGIVHRVGDVFRSVFGAISGFISGAFSTAGGIVKGAINGIIGLVNQALGGVNFLIDKANGIPGVNFPHIPTIPKLAGGGIVQVGEEGTEIVALPNGAAVYPHGSVPAGMAGGGGWELRAAPGDQVAEVLLSLLRPTVRGRYGGDVTAAMGGAS